MNIETGSLWTRGMRKVKVRGYSTLGKLIVSDRETGEREYLDPVEFARLWKPAKPVVIGGAS